MAVEGIKAEHEVSCVSPLWPLLGKSESHPAVPVLSLNCICHTKLLQSGEEVNSGDVPFHMSQEDCFLLHIACGVLLPFCVKAIDMKKILSKLK
jgi:hypothetical protein